MTIVAHLIELIKSTAGDLYWATYEVIVPSIVLNPGIVQKTPRIGGYWLHDVSNLHICSKLTRSLC